MIIIRLKRLRVIMVIVGVLLIIGAIINLIDNSKEALAFEDLKVSQLEDGKIVGGKVHVNLGCFQASYRSSSYSTKSGPNYLSKYYYVVFVEGKAIGLKCRGETHEALEKQANAFLNLTADDESVLEGVSIKGKIKDMDSETKKNLKEYLYDNKSDTSFAEIEPYIIDDEILSTGESLKIMGIGVVLIVIPFLITILSRGSANRSSRRGEYPY